MLLYIHNIFIANHVGKLLMILIFFFFFEKANDSNLNLQLKLIFYLAVTANKKLLLKIFMKVL